MYNRKTIEISAGSRKLHIRFKYDNNAPTNKYQSKDDQHCVFG